MEKGFILACSSRLLPITAEKLQKSELLRVTSHLQGGTNACSVPFPHFDSPGSHAQEMVLPTMKSNLSEAGRMAQWVEVLVAVCKPRDGSATSGILIKVEGEEQTPQSCPLPCTHTRCGVFPSIMHAYTLYDDCNDRDGFFPSLTSSPKGPPTGPSPRRFSSLSS